MVNRKLTFKSYHQHQTILLPFSLDVLVNKDDPVRVVHDVIDRIDIALSFRA
jgi:transposase